MSDVLSPSKRPKLHKLCVVGPYYGHSDIIDVLKDKYSCEVFLSPDGLDYIHDHEMVFFCSNFESQEFQNLQKQTSSENGSNGGVKILGPAIVRARIAREQEIRVPRSNRPLYCENMKDAVILLGSDVVDKRLFVNMLHYMGAKVRNDASNKINIMLTQRAVGPLIKLSANINAHVLLPDYVHHCWANRDNANFLAMDPKTLAKFAIGTFEGLNIAFLGFNPEQYEDMKEKVVSNKGKVVTSTADASHVVCNPTNKAEWDNIVPYTRQWLVTDEWIWMSVHAGRCLGEESYVVTVSNKSDKLRKSIGSPMRPGVQSSDSRTSLLDFDHSTHSVLNASAENVESIKSPAVDKRRMVVHEMLETEQSYLNALMVMLKFRDVIDSEKSVDDQPLLCKNDSQLIFGRLGPIVEVHQDICNRIKTLLENWKPNNDVARIWIDMSSQLQQAYVPYLNNYDIAKSGLEKALQNQRFYCFVKAKECSPDFKRNQLKELMIRPVQRLPSVILLLKELQKRTEKTDRLHKRLDESIHVVGNVLSKANTMRAVADEQMALYHKFTDVEDLPSHLMCNRRTFVCEVDGVIIGGTEKWQKLENKLVRLMLFNDVIIVVKIRSVDMTVGISTPNSNSTLHRMTRQTSLSTLFRQPTKPYKYLLSVPTNYIRFIREVHHQSSQGHCEEFSVLGDPPLYAFNIREAKGDDVFLLQPKENDPMKKLLAHVSAQLAMDLNRDIRGVPLDVDQLTETYVELHECLTKFVRKRASGNTFLNTTINNGTINRPSGFRRAISNAGLTVANRLSKMTASRVNLRNINENTEFSPEITSSPQGNTLMKYDTELGTPRRGIRNRLTSTLFRRDSIRQPSYDKENKENTRVTNL
ncbi:unnamed protein product [Auanema sp. JU1783]|nr:unnamed protein product [Auanema sp. JU1783]